MRHRVIVVGETGAFIGDYTTEGEAREMLEAAVHFGHRAKLVKLPRVVAAMFGFAHGAPVNFTRKGAI